MSNQKKRAKSNAKKYKNTKSIKEKKLLRKKQNVARLKMYKDLEVQYGARYVR